MPKTRLARDIMTREVITLDPEMSVTQAAKILSEKEIGGAPVVDANGVIRGLISESDLIVQDIRLHFPTFIHFLDSYIYTESLSRFEDRLKKAIGAQVKDVMTADAVTVTGDATVEDLATLMVEKDIDRIPVVEDSQVIGIVTKGNLVSLLGRD